jgi:hypothetical protein
MGGGGGPRRRGSGPPRTKGARPPGQARWGSPVGGGLTLGAVRQLAGGPMVGGHAARSYVRRDRGATSWQARRWLSRDPDADYAVRPAKDSPGLMDGGLAGVVRQQATRRGSWGWAAAARAGYSIGQLAGSEKADTKGFTDLPVHQLAPRVWACRGRAGRCAGARSTLNPRARARGCGGDSPAGGASHGGCGRQGRSVGICQLAGSRYWPAALGSLREAAASSPVDGRELLSCRQV